MPSAVLDCDADTTLDETSGTPLGGEVTLQVGAALVDPEIPELGRGLYNSLLKFDISSVPAGVDILSSTLTLNCTIPAGSAEDFSVLQVDPAKAWVEAEADWDEYATGSNWDTAGGDIDVAGGESFTTLPTSTGAAAFNVLANVVNAHNRAIDSITLLLYYSDADTAVAAFSSREDVTPANRPTLTVTWIGSESSAAGGDSFQKFTGHIGSIG